MEIIVDTLTEALGGANKTRLMYRCNLNFVRFNRYLRDLLDAGLVECVNANPEKGVLLYKTTIPPINKNTLQTIKTTIESETGTSTSTYSLEITPTFTINANTQAGPIHQVFTPTLTINFKRTDQGDIITIEDLHQTKLGEITENQTKTRYDVINQRYASYILITVSIAGLFFSADFHRKVKPTTKKIPLDKLTAPYKDLIIEAKETPETAKITTIAVKTIEDLAKTAEILARPILHVTDGKEHVFYIIDNNTKYQYKTNATTKTKHSPNSS